MTTAPARILAAVLPVTVLLAGGGWIASQDVAVSKEVAELQEALAEAGEPQVVVIGSSLADKGIDEGALALSLGLPAESVVSLTLPHAAAPVWYAVLKNRVFAAGHHPSRVLVVDALTPMLNNDLMAEEVNRQHLVDQMGDDEALLAQQVLGQGPVAWRWQRMQRKGRLLRSRLVDGWTSAVTRLGWGDEGQALLDQVNEETLGEQTLDETLTAAPFEPKQWSDEELAAWNVEDDAFLVPLARLARDNGAELTFVRLPLPPSNQWMDDVPEPIETAGVARMREEGAGYLDLRWMPFEDSDFSDMRHLGRSAALQLSSVLGRELSQGTQTRAPREGAGTVERTAPVTSGRFGQDCRARVELPGIGALWAQRSLRAQESKPSLRVSSGGTQVPVGEPAQGCELGAAVVADTLELTGPVGTPFEVTWVDADGAAGLWLAPGQGLTVSSGGWSGEVDLEVGLSQLTGGREPQLTVASGARPLQLELDALALTERIAGDDAGNVEATLTAGGWTFVDHLALGREADREVLVGRQTSVMGGSVRLVGGKLEDTRYEPLFPSAPPVPAWQPRARKTEGGWTLHLEPARDLADGRFLQEAHPNRCSPFVVLEEGEPLPHVWTPCDEVGAQRGAQCHAGEVIRFSPRSAEPAKTASLGLRVERACELLGQGKDATKLRGSWWLYPGDTMVLPVPAERLQGLQRGLAQLTVLGVPYLSPPLQPLRVRVLVGDEIVGEADWHLGMPTIDHELALPLRRRLAPWEQDVRVELHGADPRAFFLLTQLTLQEDVAPGEIPSSQRLASAEPLPVTGVEVLVGPGLPLEQSTGPGGGGLSLAPHLMAITPPALGAQGMPPEWSPLHVARGGQVLRHAAGGPGNLCDDCYQVRGRQLRAKAGGGELRAWVDTDVDLGRQPLWLPPGARARVRLPRPSSQPRVQLLVRGRRVEGERPSGRDKPVHVSLGDQGQALKGLPGNPIQLVRFNAGDQGDEWTLEFDNRGRTWFLVEQVGIVDASGLRWLVAGPDWFAETRGADILR